MEASLTVSMISVVVAFGALVVSTLVAIQQVRQMSRQNLLPVVLDAFREARTAEWFHARDWILDHLADEHSPDSGVSRLPQPARGMVRSVGFFYDNLGVFVAYKVVTEDLVIGFFGVGLNELWTVLEPYILRERQIRRMGYMVFYEDLVSRFRAREPANVYRALGLHKLTTDQESRS
jgi:hypothetical protein